MKKRSWIRVGLACALTVVGCASSSPDASDRSASAKADQGDTSGAVASAVTSCGNLRDPCCANNVCNSGLVCDQTGGLCRVGVNCGSSGQACCVGGRCASDLNCTSNTCTACGGTGQACCGMGTASPCQTGLTCQSGVCQVPCGAAGQACCNGTDCNDPGLECRFGHCRITIDSP